MIVPGARFTHFCNVISDLFEIWPVSSVAVTRD
jgi:hypothetical protein